MADAKRPRAPRALVDNAGDPEQVAAGERTLRVRQDRDEHAWRAVAATVEGRRVLSRIIDHCWTFESLAGAAKSHGDLAFFAGRQDVGHYVMAEINAAAPEALSLMAKESREEQRNG